jgi:phospholipid/cholesterol/gamma-HCH transport system substrate-binding protein
METRTPRLGTIIVIVIFVVSCFGIGLFVWKGFGGPSPFEPRGYRFTATFPGATNLAEHQDVRIAGVNVGKVVSVRKHRSDTAVTMELESRYAPVRLDARVFPRFKTLLGEGFVELTPGTPGAGALPEDGELRRRQAGRAQTIGDLLDTFDARTRGNLRMFLDDFGGSLRGRGSDLNAVLGNAAPAADALDRLTVVLDRQRGSLRTLLRDGGGVLRSVGDRSAAVRRLIAAGETLTATTAGSAPALTRAVDAFPAFLRELRSTLLVAEGAATDAEPALRALEPVAPLIVPALQEVRSLSPDARALLQRAPRVLDVAAPGLAAADRLIGGARPLLHSLDAGGRDLVPVLRLLSFYPRTIVGSLANLGAAANATIPISGKRVHIVRGEFIVADEDVLGYSKRLPGNRYNPYPAPDAFTHLLPSQQSFGCAHTANPQTTPKIGGAPPCIEQAPWSFDGKARSYPHVERDP